MNISLNLNFKSLEELAAVTKLLSAAGISANATTTDTTTGTATAVQQEKRRRGRPRKEHVVQPLQSLQSLYRKQSENATAVKTMVSPIKRRSSKRHKRYNYKKYQMFVKLDGAIQAAAHSNMCVYATRSVTDPTGTTLYFALPWPATEDERLDAMSSIRKDYTVFYNNHIGEMTQPIQRRITSKCVYGSKRRPGPGRPRKNK